MAEVLAGKYRLDRLLGRGGMGEVYDAEQLATGRRVALKRMLQHDVHGGHLLREARAVGAVRSPYIVDVLDAGTDDASGQPFLVMEFLTGSDVSSLLSQGRKLPADVAVPIAIHVCRGLEKAHAVGLVHRDIKPANLFLVAHDDDSYRVKIVDFGLARAIVHETGEIGEDDLTQLTRTNTIVGSPAYMAPEQIRGLKTLDHRSDIWSLGVVLYRMLTGRPPHSRGDAGIGDLLIAICCSPAPAVQQLAPWVSDELARIVHTALALDPEQRFQSAREMSEALEQLAPDARIDRELLGELPSTAFPSVRPAPWAAEETAERSTLALDRAPSTPDAFSLTPPAGTPHGAGVRSIVLDLEPEPVPRSKARPWLVAAACFVLAALVGTAVVLSWPPAPAALEVPMAAAQLPPRAAPLPADDLPSLVPSASPEPALLAPAASAIEIPPTSIVSPKTPPPPRRTGTPRRSKPNDPFVRTFE